MTDCHQATPGTGFRAGIVGNSAAYARLTGMDPVATRAVDGGLRCQQGVITNNSQTQQFMARSSRPSRRDRRAATTS